MRSFPWSLCLFLALGLAADAAMVRGNGTRVTVDDATGRLIELRRADGPNLLSPSQDGGLWQLTLRRADGTSVVLDPSQAEAFASTPIRGGLRLVWRNVRAPGQPDALTVTATVQTTATDKTEWRLEIDGQIAGALWNVQFPRVCGIRSLGASRLAVPHYLGRIVTNPAVNNYSVTLDYPQPASMQCFAFWTLPGDGLPAESPEAETGWLPDESAAEGLYLAAEDGAGYYKQFTVKADREAGTLSWWVNHVPGLATWPLPDDGKLRRVRYGTPYPVVLAPYVGDMQEAAGLYHDWAKDQIWCQRGKQETWPDQVKPGSKEEALWTPDWFRRIACWLKYYHEPAKILPEFAAYQEWLNVPMASHWYRYNISKFDDNYNEMLPGDPYLLQGIQDAKALGVQPLPYINGVIWDTDTESWQRENGLAAAVKDEAGEFVPWDIHGEIFAHMCPVEQWRAKMREVVRKLVGEHGMSGVYLDCLAATATRPCYDPSHGHPIRGGNYRAEGNRKLMHDLRADARSYAPEACFFTEEIGETFVDVMDGFLTLDYLRSYCRPGERVFPFFSLVYHPYTINFGSDAAIGQNPDTFRLQMGTLYTWGCQPLLSSQVALPPKKGDPDSEFLRELVRHFNNIAKPYLTGGDWVPVSVRTPGSPTSQRPIDLLVAEHQVEYAKTSKAKRVWTGPAVLASAWKRGDSLAVTMVNITDQDQPVTLTVADPASLGLPDKCEPFLHPDFSAKRQLLPGGKSTVFSLNLPAGRATTCKLGMRGQAFRAPTDIVFRIGEDGKPLTIPTSQPLAVDGATVVYAGGSNSQQAEVANRRPDGTLVARTCELAAQSGPRAEGHGLPRRTSARPFANGRSVSIPRLFPLDTAQIHSGGPGYILATCSPGSDPRLTLNPTAVATNLATGSLVKALDQEWPKDLDKNARLLVAVAHGSWLVSYMMSSYDSENMDPDGRLPPELRKAAWAVLGGRTSDQALAAASKALHEACMDVRQDPKPFVADRPLMQAMERLHALLCARTAMLPLVEIEDDWLSPGFAKTIRLTPAPGYPDRKPDSIEVVPVGDWPKGAVTVTEEVREEDRATNTHTFTLTLNDGLYVERMVPVLFFLKVTRDGHEFVIPEIVRLEANRPVHLIKPRGNTQAVSGREARTSFTLRNWSPHPVTAHLRASAEGFATKLDAETVECPALADVEIPIRFTADPTAKAGAQRIQFTVAWADLPEATVTGYAAVDLRAALVPATDTAEWAPTAPENRVTFRREGKMAIYAQAGEPIRAAIRNVRVTRYTDSLKATLRDLDNQIVWQQTIPVDESVQLEWTAKMTGAHLLELAPGSGSAVVEVQNRPVGELATKANPLNLFCSPIQRVFHVPAGAHEFRFGSSDGGLDETAAVRIVSPTGRIVLDRPLQEPSPAKPLTIAVQPEEAGQLWQLQITPRQDVSLWLDGDVCPALSANPQRGLKNAE